MAKKIRTYDMTGNEHFDDFIVGYFNARSFLRRKNFVDAKQLYTDAENEANDITIYDYNLDSLYDEKDSENFNGTKARMLGIALAFHNLGIPLDKVKEKNAAQKIEIDLKYPARLVKEYRQAAEKFNEFNFWDWIVSIFVDNGYDDAKKKRNELYNQIVNSRILHGKLPTRDQIKKGEIEALADEEIDSMIFDNFDNSISTEHDMFETILKSFDKNKKTLETIELRRYLDKNFEKEQEIDAEINKMQDEVLKEKIDKESLFDNLRGRRVTESDEVDSELKINEDIEKMNIEDDKFNYEKTLKNEKEIKEIFDKYEENGIVEANNYVENNFEIPEKMKHRSLDNNDRKNIVIPELDDKENMKQSSNQNFTGDANQPFSEQKKEQIIKKI